MNQEVIRFNFNDNEVRTITHDNEVWFVAADVAKILGYSATSAMTRSLEEDERGVHNLHTLGGEQEFSTVSEAGLYSAILRSRVPEAKQFRRWVTHEVLPSIRKHGGYVAGQEQMSPEEMVLASIKFLESKVAEQQAQLQAQAPKVLFADTVTASENSILIGTLAKFLAGKGVNIGQNRLFKWMREHGFLCKAAGERYNKPTAKAMNLGLFEVNESFILSSKGEMKPVFTTKVTGKGQEYFINIFLSEKTFEEGDAQ